jgi:ketosteroid isomerase-like protein
MAEETVQEAQARNEALLRAGYGAFAQGDLATVEKTFHPDAVWHAQRLGQLGGDHDGWDAILRFFGGTMELTGGTFRVELRDVLTNGTMAAAVVRSTGRRAGKTLDSRQVHLFRFEDGRAAEIWQYTDGTADEFWSG